MNKENELAVQAAHQAGRAVVLHALLSSLLATQRLGDAEVITFFKTMRRMLEKEVSNTDYFHGVLHEAGFEEHVSSKIVDAFRKTIKLQLKLIETNIP